MTEFDGMILYLQSSPIGRSMHIFPSVCSMFTLGLIPHIRFAEIEEQSRTPLGCEVSICSKFYQEDMGGFVLLMSL